MKKLAPLRKQKRDEDKKSSLSDSSQKKQKIKANNNNNDNDDDDDEWERIEKNANKADNTNDNDDNDDDDDDEDEEDDIPLQNDSKTFTEEQYTFDFNDISENHIESVTTILKSSLFGNPTTSYQIAQDIVSSSIGTCIVNEGSEDVFAFASVLTLDQLKSSNSPLNKLIEDILANISKVSSSTATKVMKLFESQLKDKSNEVGILLHSRFTNLPIQLITPLHKNLIDDIKWAKTEGSKSEKGLKKVLLLSSCNISDNDNTNKTTSKSENSITDVTGSSNIMHDYFENDIFCQHSNGILHMKTSIIQNKALTISLVDIDKLDKCLNEISNMLD